MLNRSTRKAVVCRAVSSSRLAMTVCRWAVARAMSAAVASALVSSMLASAPLAIAKSCRWRLAVLALPRRVEVHAENPADQLEFRVAATVFAGACIGGDRLGASGVERAVRAQPTAQRGGKHSCSACAG
jgi:hypothetical protein